MNVLQGVNSVTTVAHSIGFCPHSEHLLGLDPFNLTLEIEGWGVHQGDNGVPRTSLCPPIVSWILFCLIKEYENIL